MDKLLSIVLTTVAAYPHATAATVTLLTAALFLARFSSKQAPDPVFNVTDVQTGKRYMFTVDGEEASFLVLSTNEGAATFKVRLSMSHNTPGQDEGWVYEIKRNGNEMPTLFYDALMAQWAMEQKLSVGREKGLTARA